MGSVTESKRVFPPLYVATGNVSEDRLAFIHILERLKTQKRTGWVERKIPNPERHLTHNFSILEHMKIVLFKHIGPYVPNGHDGHVVRRHQFRRLKMRNDGSGARSGRGARDLSVGDIAPQEGIPKTEKHRLEAEAMHNFVHDMLHNSPAAQKIEALWREYEEGQTAEAIFVKDLDRFEMASQALEYERNSGAGDLQTFFDNSIPKLRHPQVQEWGRNLMDEREQLHRSTDNSIRK